MFDQKRIMALLTIAFGLFMLIWETVLGFIFCSVMLLLYWASNDFGYKPYAENKIDQEEDK